MAEGPFGGPRPFAKEEVEFMLVYKRPPEIQKELDKLEAELSKMIEPRVDMVGEYEFSETIQTGETVDKLSSVVIKIRNDELRYVELSRVMDFIDNKLSDRLDKTESRML